MPDEKPEALARIARDLPKLIAAASTLRNPLLDAALQMAEQELKAQITREHQSRQLANDDLPQPQTPRRKED
jgi:hypothetical protein